jgi:hypothetical protein
MNTAARPVVLGELGSPFGSLSERRSAECPESRGIGAGGGNRTRDLPLTRRALYRLSYPGVRWDAIPTALCDARGEDLR